MAFLVPGYLYPLTPLPKDWQKTAFYIILQKVAAEPAP